MTFRQVALYNVFTKPRLELVQTAAILTLCNSHFGESEREVLLLRSAIGTARALQMHRLGTESTFPRSLCERAKWSTPAGRQLGRRLWWSLAITDW